MKSFRTCSFDRRIVITYEAWIMMKSKMPRGSQSFRAKGFGSQRISEHVLRKELFCFGEVGGFTNPCQWCTVMKWESCGWMTETSQVRNESEFVGRMPWTSHYIPWSRWDAPRKCAEDAEELGWNEEPLCILVGLNYVEICSCQIRMSEPWLSLVQYW